MMRSCVYNDLKESIETVTPEEVSKEKIPLRIQLQKRQEEVDKKNLKHKIGEVNPLDASFLESETPNYADSISSEIKTK